MNTFGVSRYVASYLRTGELLDLTASSADLSVLHIFSIACELVVVRGVVRDAGDESDEVDVLCCVNV
jgi:hypothetical protein